MNERNTKNDGGEGGKEKCRSRNVRNRDRAYFPHTFRPLGLAALLLSLSLSVSLLYPARFPFVPFRSPLRSFFRSLVPFLSLSHVRLLRYPANINGVERTLATTNAARSLRCNQ